MELKVSVDGVQRIVCGVTEKTTCQEVVIALAQALGRTGRYTLKEKFKEFERNVTPEERLLESLGKYGQQCREVQLTLLHNGPSLGGGGADGPQGGSQQACAPLRRVDAGVRGRRGSCGLHRQSLPPLSRLHLHVDSPQLAEAKKPKRKSLTLVEEAFGWLENLSRSGRQQRGREREKSKEPERTKGRASPNLSAPASVDCTSPADSQGTGCHRKGAVTVHQQRTSIPSDPSSCKDRDGVRDDAERDGNQNKHTKKDQEIDKVKPEVQQNPKTQGETETEEGKLRALLTHQRALLHELQLRMDATDTQIKELEERQRVWLNRETLERLMEEDEDADQPEYWENELRAEEGYERDLQEQFLEMKEKAAECKAKLEEYKRRLQGLDPARGTRTLPGAEVVVDPEQDCSIGALKPVAPRWTQPHTSTLCTAIQQDEKLQQTRNSAWKGAEREERPTVASHHHQIRVSPYRITHSQAKGASQLREWWSRWSEAQAQSGPKEPVVHRSELTIQLGSTRV
ncbi:ras association domain-containing protein 8 [Megalops cyprinoides]|uniref:ras association domain-containing protein 8 n=1 Tax=Megalops cyprinoides TaxID=118141 RepID=UPI001863EF72|nr:ras association domain-containing protein 8 [Megalops cyprinoides]XP_036389641.1 ras association domain-containing protein 8 [Megalops cyprinoides]